MAFGSFANKDVTMGSFTLENNDFFLDPTNPSPSYSFTGLNGSFRSPNMSTVPLGSYTSRTPLSGSYGRERMSQMRKEAEFCKDFMCCGKDLGSLHDLLEHYEEAHVVVISSPTTSHMELSMEIDAENDVEMDDFDEAPSSSSSDTTTTSAQTSPVPSHSIPGLLPTGALKQLALEDVIKPSTTKAEESAFESCFVSSPPQASRLTSSSSSSSGSSSRDSYNLARQAFPGGRFSAGASPNHASSAFAIRSVFGPSVRKDEKTESGSINPLTAVPPNVLFMSNSSGAGQAAQPPVITPETTTTTTTNTSTTASTSSSIQATPSGFGGGDQSGSGSGGEGNGNRNNMPNGEPQPSLFATHRPFRCPQPGCQKSYKQSNGLKYHMSKGQCNFEVRDAVEWGGLTQEEAEEKSRPFVCAAGEGCTKRYRQMNGLKYHYMNSGLHGEVGLILLAQGQHPHPASLPQPASKPRPSSSTIVSSTARNGPTANASANAFRTGGWVKDAQKATGKHLGLPMGGNEVRGERRGEEAVLFSTEDEMFA
jgi:transcription factor SFP1